MKISCQSCQSKYNVADEKVQGKIVKIRCRKCGATIVVNATSTAAANGSIPAPAAPSAPAMTAREPEPATAGAADTGAAEWHVSISDNDQRTMSLAELVNAYNTGVVAADSFVWTEGMQDWKALSEVDAVVAALHAAAAGEAPAAAGGYGYAATGSANASPTYATSPAAAASPSYATSPAAASPAYAAPAATASPAYSPAAAASPAYGASPAAAASPAYEAPAPARTYERTAAYAAGLGLQAAVAAPAAEPKRAAVVKRESRARDLFATRTGEDAHAGMHLQDSAEAQLTGQRNENSVLFSLEHLTKSAEPRPPGGATTTEDSGIIDLKALAAKAESMRPPTLHENQMGPANLGLAPAQFAAPIGGYAPLGGAETVPKSRLPVLIGAGAGIALLLVLGIIIGLKIGGAVAPAPMPSAIASAPPIPSASATAEPSATASASATAQASASAAPSAKPHGYGGGAFHAKAQGVGGAGAGAGAAGGGGASGTGAAAATGGGAGGAGQTTAPKKNDCGCNGDLMCMMKCSTHQ